MNRSALRDREPFGPLVALSRRGVMHRAKAGPILHTRCRGGRPFVGEVLTNEQAVEWATGREWALCRYPWCFRELLRAAGIDPEVGHMARAVDRGARHRVEREPRTAPHVADPIRDHEVCPTWAWCRCGGILVRLHSAHNPAVIWWQHKGRRGKAA